LLSFATDRFRASYFRRQVPSVDIGQLPLRS
jgi:hypothetical protein